MDDDTTWWIIIRKPGNVFHVWPAGDDPTDDELNAARTLVGFPPNDDWLEDGSGWDISLSRGKPHKDLMELATVGTLSDLGKADPAAVAAHAEARRQGYADRHVKAAKKLLAGLDDATLATVLADPAIAKRMPKGVKP